MNKKEIESNISANKIFDEIRIKLVDFIQKNINNITEKDLSDFIVLEMEKNGLVLDNINPIHFVVVNENTDDSHWEKERWKYRVIKKDSLIMADYWAKIKGSKNVFADITWMFYVGNKIPKEIEETFDMVVAARNLALVFIRKELKRKRIPYAREVDNIVRRYFFERGIDKYFTHRTGHSLGKTSCHGKAFSLLKNSKKIIGPNILFTIEPGIYFPNKFGIRSEINCYIDEQYKLMITSSVQDEIIKI